MTLYGEVKLLEELRQILEELKAIRAAVGTTAPTFDGIADAVSRQVQALLSEQNATA